MMTTSERPCAAMTAPIVSSPTSPGPARAIRAIPKRSTARTMAAAAAAITVGLLCAVPASRGDEAHAAAPPRGDEAAPAAPAPDIEGARGALQKWVETQQIISREKKDWQQGREILTSRIQLVKDEIAQLRQKLEESHKSESEFLKSRSEVVGERDTVKAVASELSADVGGLEAKVRALYKVMPESLRDKVQPLYDRMPADPATTRVTVAERFQNVLGILNEMNRLSGEITVASEIRPLSDGKPSEVKTIYLGLAQAWYLSARGEAGVGRPTADGWTWQPAPEVATDVARVLEILQNKSSPKFIPLPVTIQ